MIFCLLFFFTDPATTEIYTLSLHDALPIFAEWFGVGLERVRLITGDTDVASVGVAGDQPHPLRSEEHTSELQSRRDLVCRLLLEKKKKSVTRCLKMY